MSAGPRTVLLSCGEASGDLYVSRIARALSAQRPHWRLVGVAGPKSVEAGVEPWFRHSQLQVMGFGEVLRHLPRMLRLGRELVERAADEQVDLFVPVDYPGFHTRVAGRMRKRGIAVLDVIPPKTWSWGAWRLRSLPQSVDRCAVIFPFEEEHYRGAGIDARFVGHPLMDLYGGRLPSLDGELSSEGPLLIVPGSRRQEIRRLAEPLAAAVRSLASRGLARRVRVSRAPGVDEAWLSPLRTGLSEVEISERPLLEEFAAASSAIVCSGTASMEAALVGCPHVIVYRTSPLTFAVARRLASVEHIGMANIVLGRRAFPELLQGDCSASRIGTTIEALARDRRLREAQRQASRELRELLAGSGCFDTVAAMAIEMLESAD